MAQHLRIALIGGGTGGHIYPLIAVTNQLKDMARRHGFNITLRFFGSAGHWQSMLEGYGLSVRKVAGSKIRRYFSPLNLLEPFKFIWSLIQSFWHLFWFMPDVVFSKGGPGSLSVVIAAAFYRIPIIIHESDAVPSLTNKLSGRLAKSIGISFPDTATFFKSNQRVALTGHPVRAELLNNRDDQSFAKRYWGFDPNRPVILVLGGSQGAAALNDFIIQISPTLLSKNYQVLHQTGTANFKEARGELTFFAKNIPAEQRRGYHLTAYFNQDIKEAYLAADLVISRAGAGSIFELSAFGKPAVLVPLPNSAGDHQRYNAEYFASRGGGVIIDQSNLKEHIFLVQVDKILSHPDRLKTMSAASTDFFIPQSAEMLAEEILRLAR